uniref:Uncharacterized protein n=1 Tax=Odontella aurita TaxID=265563 RepID=A0A7S4IWS3_9STRA|mmetsp:Transcript_31625/g.94599  ORF Transcript_31625/g.94599 Transcript_31625/m.94599 type:complete len:100 (+) Transcript_31625:118-417(+)
MQSSDLFSSFGSFGRAHIDILFSSCCLLFARVASLSGIEVRNPIDFFPMRLIETNIHVAVQASERTLCGGEGFCGHFTLPRESGRVLRNQVAHLSSNLH